MRVHCDASHPDYWRLRFVRGPRVLVDGQRVKDVIEADDVAGVAIVRACDADGELLLDEAGERVVFRTLRGTVRIEGERRRAPGAGTA